MLVYYKPGDSRLPQRGAFAPTPTSQLYQHWYVAAFTTAPQLKPLCFRSVIRLCQHPAASRTYYPSMFYQCFVGDFLIFWRPAQKLCPLVFPVPPVLRRWFWMAVEYNLYRPGTRPHFFRLPQGWGGQPGPVRCPPPDHHAPRRQSAIYGHRAMISPFVIKNPTNRPIWKHLVIHLVRIICIVRTSAHFCPFAVKILRRNDDCKENFPELG